MQLSPEQLAAFDRDGYLRIGGLFSAEEARLLNEVALADREKSKLVRSLGDASGGTSKLWLASDVEKQDIYNAICHGRRVVEPMEQLLRDEVYLYHYKMMVKEPRVGGAWEWHQDYGYWYNNDCLFPDMASCMIAVDRANKANGCLQVLRGSHRMGRIEHGRYGDQTGADPKRVELAQQHLELVYCELEPGDALFFHSNTLHRSDQNRSENPRWSLICCYNARHNPCSNKSGHPNYTPLEKWDDDQVLAIGRKQLEALRSQLA